MAFHDIMHNDYHLAHETIVFMKYFLFYLQPCSKSYYPSWLVKSHFPCWTLIYWAMFYAEAEHDHSEWWQWMGELFPMLLAQEQFSLSVKKVLKFVCTVIWTIEFYFWTCLVIEGIDWFKLRNQDVPILLKSNLCTYLAIMVCFLWAINFWNTFPIAFNHFDNDYNILTIKSVHKISTRKDFLQIT